MTNTMIYVIFAFIAGIFAGVFGFIGICKLIWYVQGPLKMNVKCKLLNFMERMSRKVESL